MDFTISGHLNRALFITDNDAGTAAAVKNNGSSGTRIRVKGSSEMEAGGSAGVNLEYGAGSTLGLRYADIWYGGAFGKVSIGQGDQGGEGSVYSGSAATGAWIGHGMDQSTLTKDAAEPAVAVPGAPPLKGTLSNYFGSLDGGGGRTERIRYDTPAVGPLSAAVSIGNGDSVSAGLTLSQDLAGTAFSAKVGTIQAPGDTGTLSASAGVTLPSGLKISGAWGKGKHHAGMTIPAVAAGEGTPAMPAKFASLDARAYNRYTHATLPDVYGFSDPNAAPGVSGYSVDDQYTESGTFDARLTALETALTTAKENAGDEPTSTQLAAIATAQKAIDDFFAVAFDRYACDPGSVAKGKASACIQRLQSKAQAAVPGTDAIPAMPTQVDPSFYQAAIGYVFGNTQVGVSWYQSQDFVMKGSKGTAIGIGVNHVLPKVNADVYASVQNYKVTPMKGGKSMDDTVAMIGTRIKF